MISRIVHSPVFVAVIYIALVPAYGVVYYLTPRFWESSLSFIESQYFSVVTITTLGYGEITPQTEAARIVTASEAILGVLVIGLFLNAVAHRANEAKENRRKQAVKTHLLAQYHQWREDLCSAALRCAVGHYGVEFGTAERLSNYEEFREEFAGDSRDKFYDVMNGIQDNPQFLEDIFTISGLFAQQINAAIGAAQSENTKSIAILTRVSQHPHLLQSLDVYQADPAKYVGQYLFEVLAMWSNTEGYLKTDFINDAIDSL
mgnify:CR=1 FL=1